ncbi:MAG: hypothetical protein FJ290_21270 [Planctomycetes bacterium]|nr:hypothetical protein [Planctomycetota bacterium]
MPNVTIALNERLLAASRDYAQRHGTSLNALIRECLNEKVGTTRAQSLQAFFDAADKAHGNSRGWKWNREEIYEEIYKRWEK